MFLENVPLEYVAMYVLVPLTKTTLGRQYIVVITDRYYKVTRSVPTAKKMASHIS